jgi:hypothetical protein
LFASTEEKLGAELLAPALLDGLLLELLEPPEAALPPDDDVPDDPLDMPDEPLELDPEAAGEDEDLSLLVLLEELWAMAALDSANSAAAVAALSTLRFNIGKYLLGVGETASRWDARHVPRP